MKRAVIALGGNLSDPIDNLQTAFCAIQQIPETTIECFSSLYRTRAEGYIDQPDFINAIIIVQTLLTPNALLSALHRIENEHGRTRLFTNAPRTLDLDIVDYQGVRSNNPQLTVPHPRATERIFVMAPLAQIAPDYVIEGKRAIDWRQSLDDNGIVRLDEKLDAKRLPVD